MGEACLAPTMAALYGPDIVRHQRLLRLVVTTHAQQRVTDVNQ